MGNSEGSPEREVHTITGLPKKRIETFQINNLIWHLQQLEEQQQRQPQSKYKEGNNQDQSRIK